MKFSKIKSSTVTAQLFFVVCLIVIFNKAFGCRPSWRRYDDHCYRIYENTNSRDTAGRICQLEGSDLASISNTSILDFLTQHSAHFLNTKHWIGLERIGDELVWSDGTRLHANQSWVTIPESNEHLSTEKAALSDTNCFAYDGKVVAKEQCHHLHAFLCGYPTSNNRNRLNCYPSSENISFIGDATGNCIYRIPHLSSMDKVEDSCKANRNGHFVDFNVLMRNGLSAIYDYKVFCNDGSKYWTNLSWNGSRLLFSNGQVVPEEYPVFLVEGSGTCITVQFNFTDNLSIKFYQTDCNKQAYVVCSLDSDNLPDTPSAAALISVESLLESSDGDNCPEGYNWKADRMKNYCYWETSFETDQLSWDDAEKFCQGYGGHLASFHSEEEEKIGLSFQYGSLAHDYWIGLTLDPNTESYKWIDNSSLDYSNWAPGHPNHKDKQLRCVSMHAQDKHWTSSLCGILSWFICKVPKRSYHPSPSLPSPTPLEPCEKNSFSDKSSWYFQGACYFPVVDSKSWHRAKQYCEDQGGSLVSIHSTEEIGFLLRLLHNSEMETNRIWIGLNSFGPDGSFRWTDWTVVDFTYFAPNEPDNYHNQEKCCNMNTRNGQWVDENCNAALGFICKRINDTSVSTVIPTTMDPRIGNCKKGWIAHNDRCYYIGGKREKDRLNWTEALDFCRDNGGYLTSIRDAKEQNFLAYLLQTLGSDAWIGLHDTIQSGKYYWLDNSELQYTNWSPGEPSFFGIMEDCVKMIYNHMNSGVWQDDVCIRKIGFICQSSKDPQLPPPSSERGMNCIHPEGWLKLDTMCFKMFDDDQLTWIEAEDACQKEGGHLVSVSDQKVKAVVTYLATEVNRPFSIGLKYDEKSHTVRWLNNFPIRLTNWEKNEPSQMREDTCFASTSEGYWKKTSCDEKMPYLCQITTGKYKKLNRFVGKCSPTSELWHPGSQSYCYILNAAQQRDWYTANINCFRMGSNLISIHSMEEIEDIKKLLKPRVRSIYIGLMRNYKGGFTWTDDSPVNFVNWDEGEPANSEDGCVEMMTDNMKWRVTPCLSQKHFICMDTKGTLVNEDPESAQFTSENAGLSTAAICAVVFSLLVVVMVVVAAVLYRKKTYRMPQFRRQERDSSVSFENALYEVGSSRMVFSDENKS